MTLKQLRQWEGLTQQEAAARINVSVPTWSRLESEEEDTSYNALISKAFNVAISITPDGKTDFDFPNAAEK